jgi:hydrogenase nickel incorporation protein HypB
MSTIIRLDKKILEKNDIIAARMRDKFKSGGIAVVNIMSSPGAGKTTLLEETIRRLSKRMSLAVIAGDIATDYDAKRLENAGCASVVQINSGGRCHLEAAMVEKAFEEITGKPDLLIIENIGNLVCPAGFDLGEDERVMLAALTEGLDKPKKYPGMYRSCGHVVINKIDLAQVLNIDPERFEHEALAVNPRLGVFKTSATRGDGLDEWCGWLESMVKG